jgi:hypothetical protein
VDAVGLAVVRHHDNGPCECHSAHEVPPSTVAALTALA